MIAVQTARAADVDIVIPGGSGGLFSTNIYFNVSGLNVHKTVSITPAPCYRFDPVPSPPTHDSTLQVNTLSSGECGVTYDTWLVSTNQGWMHVSGTIVPGGCGCTGGSGTPPPSRNFQVDVLQRMPWMKFTEPTNGTNLTICAGSAHSVAVKVTLGDAYTPSAGTVAFSASPTSELTHRRPSARIALGNHTQIT